MWGGMGRIPSTLLRILNAMKLQEDLGRAWNDDKDKGQTKNNRRTLKRIGNPVDKSPS
jgi:hypothetical protein